MDCGTLAPKAQNASLPLREAGAILHIGMIMGGEVEQLCRFVGILVYSNRQAFLMRYPNKKSQLPPQTATVIG